MPLNAGRFSGQTLDLRATSSQRGMPGAAAALLGGVGFTPLVLRPVLWLDAADTSTITSSGGAVSAWADKSGNGYSAAQATSTKQPTTGSSTLNGLNVLSFDGGDCLQVSSFNMTGGSAWTLWAVITATSGSERIIMEHTADFNATAGAWILYRNASNQADLGKRGIGLYSTFASSATITTTAKCIVATHDGALTLDESAAWVNGDGGGSRSFNNNTASNNVTATLNIGSRNNAASVFLNGTIAELGVITRAINAQERLALEAYLKKKWAL